MTNFSLMLLSSVAFGGLLPATAQAQDVAPAQAEQAAGQDVDSAESRAQIGEIVVTAQRRGESSQKVPISVSAVDMGALSRSGITETAGLQSLVPGLTFSRTINAGLPRLRGIGTNNPAPGDESAIAVYVDDVYRPASAGNLTGFNNIERIEVLKGPQGTLFGRNASGGVINIITRTPSTTPELDAKIGYSNFDTVNASLYGTAGLTDNIALDIAGDFRHQGEGWGKNLTTGADTFKTNYHGLRSKLLLDFDTTQITLSADYNKFKTDVGAGVRAYPGAILVDGQSAPAGFFDLKQNFASLGNSEQYGFSGKIRQDIGFADLISITAWRKVDNIVRYDQDGTANNIIAFSGETHDRSFSQELQLQSKGGGSFTWILGGFYFFDKSDYAPLQVTGLGVAPATQLLRYNSSKVYSLSVFGQGTLEVAADTKLTLGARYTQDIRKINNISYTTLANGNVTTTGPITDRERFPKVTYRASIDHQFTPTVLGYASLSRGFKSGVYDLVSGAARPVNPEVVDAYEIGVKSDLFDRRVRLNVAAYLNDISNLQTTAFVTGLGQVLLNAGKARSKGFDAELEVAATPELRLRANAAYLDAKFVSYRGAPFFQPRGAPAGGNITLPDSVSDASGRTIPRSPDFTFSIGGDYTIASSIGDFVVDANLFRSSSYFWDPQNRLKQPAYTLVNGSIKWTSPDRGFDLRLWVNNLTDERYYSNASFSGLGDFVSPAEPRTFGVTLGVHLK